MRIPNDLYTTVVRHLGTTTAAAAPARLPTSLYKIPSKYKPLAIKEAQQILAEYLHSTRSIPYTYAEYIAQNSLSSINSLISNANLPRFSTHTFSKSLVKHFRYHPINEFEFFFESIGIDHGQVRHFLPANKFFFCEDRIILDAAQTLAGFGFPWTKLGSLYKEEVSIFRKDSRELSERLCGFKREYGFTNVTITGICLAFPYVLSADGELNGEIGRLFDDLTMVFVHFDLESCVEGKVDAWLDICRKIKVFYDLGCEKGKMGELMGRNKSLFVDYSEETLLNKAEYFCRFGVTKKDVGLLLLERTELLDFDLEEQVISVLGFLKHLGLSAEELEIVTEKYPYVLGRNKMVNLPHVMRAMNLHNWFFNKIRNGSHLLLGNYVLGYPDEDKDKEYIDTLERIHYSRYAIHTMHKLNVLHGIGFGENWLTVKVLAHMHGTSSELQERVDCLIHSGIVFSKLCMMIKTTPKILNQKPEILERKIIFLCQEMGSSLEYLDTFPAFLNFNLENRIKPRYRFHLWLMEKGLCTKNYSIASMVATSEKSFMDRVYRIHPAALKQWLERFSC
ncbi:putative Mitochondrial transcription termination factor family protein [Tripterygium wilfordii]|uniref:Putative Mitochondrial transcription termination factor family protein n=1 Tax=Tripterygium wilfordii TaxID=458696 RepID=A0A7J7CFF6_TRIWF|nr:transcription termination factor MTEF18, mitochondrial [Tripterygium wilfordii]KAF5732888.1 putative Mitochondrial transcription termination factor family protein [Tripterygium wilfordii]